MDMWDRRFMETARLVATWSSCYQENRMMGAVIVKNKRIMTTGYNGAPAGVRTCRERGACLRRQLDIPSGTRLEACYATHGEENAIIQAAKMGINIDGGTLYTTLQPCSRCAKVIINVGIVRVVYENAYTDAFSMELFDEAGIQVERYEG